MSSTQKMFGIAAIIFATAQFINSIQPSHAIPGPSVQTSSNPIFNLNGREYMNSVHTITVWTNTTQNDLIITTIVQNTSSCRFTIDGETNGLVNISNYSLIQNYKPSSAFLNGTAKLKVPVGSTLDLRHFNTNGNDCDYYVEGYFVRP